MMNKTKFWLYSLLLGGGALALLVPAGSAHAQGWSSFTGIFDWSTISSFSGNPESIVTNVISALLIVAGVIAFVYLVWAGFLYITAGGDPEKTEAAKKAIINAVIGIIVIFIALGIIMFIKNRIESPI